MILSLQLLFLSSSYKKYNFTSITDFNIDFRSLSYFHVAIFKQKCSIQKEGRFSFDAFQIKREYNKLHLVCLMHTTKNIQKFRQNQLRMGISSKGSWHKDYDSAYIFIGNLNYGMNEGDIVIVFSEFGEIVDLRLIRDKETGKSKGYAFLAYEDQRSTDLAVDNFNGTQICGRVLRVDHVKKYNPPKEFLQLKEGVESKQYRPTGPDGKGWGRFRQKTEQQLQIEKQYLQKKQRNIQSLKQKIGLKSQNGD